MTAVIWILIGLAVAAVGAAIVVAVVKKVPIIPALEVVGLAVLAGALLAAGVAVALFKRKKDEEDSGGAHDLPAPDVDGIGAIFNAGRDRIAARIKAVLLKAGGG